MARHIMDKANEAGCECASIPSQTMRDFWEALASVVDGSLEKVSIVDIPSWSDAEPFCRRSRLCVS
jgi:hypothetical protein